MYTADVQTDLSWSWTRSPTGWWYNSQAGILGSSSLSVSCGKIQDGLQALEGRVCLSLRLWPDEIERMGPHSGSRSDRAGKTKGQQLRTASNMAT